MRPFPAVNIISMPSLARYGDGWFLSSLLRPKWGRVSDVAYLHPHIDWLACQESAAICANDLNTSFFSVDFSTATHQKGR